jgi:cysteine desulfurase
LPNVANITMPNVPSETQVIYFDTNSVCVSAGSACSSGKVELPRVQMSMGYSEVESRTALRISLGVGSTMDEAKIFCDLWKDLYRNTNKLNNAV